MSRAVFGAVVVVLGTGCASDPHQGYSLTGVHSTDIKTVAVVVFENSTYATGLEVPLTEAVVKEVQSRTPWKVVALEDADATLSGAIQSSQLSNLSNVHTTGLVQEMAVTLGVSFELRDNRTGRTIVERRNLAASDTFVPERRSAERIEVGQSGAINRLARAIVAELRSDW